MRNVYRREVYANCLSMSSLREFCIDEKCTRIRYRCDDGANCEWIWCISELCIEVKTMRILYRFSNYATCLSTWKIYEMCIDVTNMRLCIEVAIRPFVYQGDKYGNNESMLKLREFRINVKNMQNFYVICVSAWRLKMICINVTTMQISLDVTNMWIMFWCNNSSNCLWMWQICVLCIFATTTRILYLYDSCANFFIEMITMRILYRWSNMQISYRNDKYAECVPMWRLRNFWFEVTAIRVVYRCDKYDKFVWKWRLWKSILTGRILKLCIDVKSTRIIYRIEVNAICVSMRNLRELVIDMKTM